MKKKRLAIILSSIAVLALIGGTYAAFVTSTSTEHKVSTQNLKIEIHQQSIAGEELVQKSDSMTGIAEGSVSYSGMPGDVVEEKMWIKNAGTEDCYVRVTINRSWMNGEDKVFADNVDTREIKIQSEEGWFITEDPDDEEVLYCYYKQPLTKEHTETTQVMKEFSILVDALAENNNAYAGLAANLEFEVDAIQAYAAEEAMLSEWGIVAKLQDGVMTGEPRFQ